MLLSCHSVFFCNFILTSKNLNSINYYTIWDSWYFFNIIWHFKLELCYPKTSSNWIQLNSPNWHIYASMKLFKFILWFCLSINHVLNINDEHFPLDNLTYWLVYFLAYHWNPYRILEKLHWHRVYFARVFRMVLTK